MLMEEKVCAADWLHLSELLEPYLSVGRLSGGVAHNLNGYLTGLIGHVELMKMKHPDLGKELDVILSLSRKLRDGVAEMSTKLDNELTREAQPQNINQILRATLNFLKADLHFKHSIQVELALQESLPNVYGYYADFSLALEAILQNAVDAQRDKSAGWILVRSTSDSQQVRIEIEDGGAGFSDEALEMAFLPLQPAFGFYEDGLVRAGLGLTLAQMRLQRWGGSISIGNGDRGSARVVITLPRRDKVRPG
jgi:C4-dicarboxylate-specific signal transduction histidine kinase